MVEIFEGATTALITPIKSDGTLNRIDFKNLLLYQVQNGIHGLMPCGTTGQSPTLTWQEHQELIRATLISKGFSDRVFVIAGAGSNNTEEGVEATKHAKEIGADATLHVTGYYNCPSQQGFADYFSEIAKAADCKVIIYNIPGRGHPIILPELMVALAKEFPNIIGTKDATGGRAAPLYFEEKSFWRALRQRAKDAGLGRHSFKMLSGDDSATYAMMSDSSIEGAGVISVWSNLFPHAYAKMAEHLLKGEYEEAKKIDDELANLNSLVGVKTKSNVVKIGKKTVWTDGDTFRNPEAVQLAAYVLGMISSPSLRSPMGFLPEEEWGRQVGSELLKLYEGEMGDFLFKPIEEFYQVKDMGDRLSRYKI